jgi:tRNA(fMet)-specific endonuclease VapC
MSFLLDTNTCIYYLNKASAGVVAQFRKLSPSQIKLPAITVAELYYGAEKSKAKSKNLETVEDFVTTFEVLPFDGKCCESYGKIRAFLERSGVPIGPMDLLIASIGMANNCILVTNNTREFKRIKGLRVDNWL